MKCKSCYIWMFVACRKEDVQRHRKKLPLRVAGGEGVKG